MKRLAKLSKSFRMTAYAVVDKQGRVCMTPWGYPHVSVERENAEEFISQTANAHRVAPVIVTITAPRKAKGKRRGKRGG